MGFIVSHTHWALVGFLKDFTAGKESFQEINVYAKQSLLVESLIERQHAETFFFAHEQIDDFLW